MKRNKHQHTIKLAKIKITFVVSKCDDFGGSMIPALVKEITKGDDQFKDAVKKLLPQFERAEVCACFFLPTTCDAKADVESIQRPCHL